MSWNSPGKQAELKNSPSACETLLKMDSPCSSIRIGQDRVEEWQKFQQNLLLGPSAHCSIAE